MLTIFCPHFQPLSGGAGRRAGPGPATGLHGHKFEHGLVRNANRVSPQTFAQELGCDCLFFRKAAIKSIDQNVRVNQGGRDHIALLSSSHGLRAGRLLCPLSSVDAFAAV